MTIQVPKALNTRRPFTRKEALLSGLADNDLAGRRFRRIFHGIYVAADVDITVAVRARAALLVAPPGSYASHHTAVLLWGGWSPPTPEIHLSSPIRSTRSERRGVVAHVADPALVSRRRQGVAVSPPARAFLELASTRPNLVDLVVAGDSLVTAAALPPEDLVAAADQWTGRWCRLARRAARLVRTGVNSPMESRVRMLVVLAGLPEPTTNHIVRYPNGDWRRRLDLAYVGDRVVIEYDGRHHLNTAQRRSDILRREELEREGWLFIVLVSEDVYDEPEATVERVRTALVDRGQHLRRRRLSPEWVRCYPGRPSAA
jgi:hypothetical protein